MPDTGSCKLAPMRTLVLLLLPVALVFATGAAADGEPASDVLATNGIFTPYPPPSVSAVQTLHSAVQGVAVKGDRIKVAVIATRQDLGSIPSLFGHPQDYSRFLSLELSLLYRGPLLVVMPAGFGFVDRSHAVPHAGSVLAARDDPGTSADELTIDAATAIGRLEQAGLLHFKDTLAPQPHRLSAVWNRTEDAVLWYQVWDDSGRAKVEIELLNTRNDVIARLHVPLRAVAQGVSYFVL